MPDQFSFDLHWVGSRVILLRLTGDLDTTGAQLIASAWKQTADEAGTRQTAPAMAVVADLRQLTFIDRTGVRELERVSADARELGARFVLVSAPAPVQRVLDLAGLFAAGTIPPDEAEEHDPSA